MIVFLLVCCLPARPATPMLWKVHCLLVSASYPS
uniref:Uncharacterized protein n=1 Tax=Setaria viridis TaxID=4556 RepID=A0A4V6D5U0_SETVI|nr:hypothetical protein SEVIR_6G255250v2 [Setaria viridis]